MKDLGIGCNFDEIERTSFLMYDPEFGLFLLNESNATFFLLLYFTNCFSVNNLGEEHKIALITEMKDKLSDKQIETYRGTSFTKMQETLFPNRDDVDIDDDDDRSFISGKYI